MPFHLLGRKKKKELSWYEKKPVSHTKKKKLDETKIRITGRIYYSFSLFLKKKTLNFGSKRFLQKCSAQAACGKK